jgi:hypothetical protein
VGQSHSDNVQARIKDATVLTLVEDGLANLEVRAVCIRARVSQDQFHEHWPDAWAVLLEAIDDRTRLPTLPDTGNLIDDLVAYARGHARLGADAMSLKFMSRLRAEPSPDLRRRLAPGFVDRRVRNLVVIQRAVARGEAPPDIDGNAILDAMVDLSASLARTDRPWPEPDLRRAVQDIVAGVQRAPTNVPTDAAAGVYKLFLFDPAGDERGLGNAEPEALGSHTDGAAIANANARRGGRYAELWKDGVLLHIFEPDVR